MMKPLLPLALLLPCLFGLSSPPRPAARGERPALDPAQPYSAKKVKPVTYDVDFSVVVTAPYGTKALKVWLPLPPSDAAQTYEQKELTTFPQAVKPSVGQEKAFGNRFAFFEFKKPEGAQIIRHRFKVRTHELHWGVDPAKVTKVDRWPAGFAPYLRSDRSVTVNDALRKVLDEVVPKRRGPADDLADVMDWVNEKMTYDHATASLKASSGHALTVRRGHCSDYHGLCAAMGRALGYPTRVTYGINTFPKNSPSHCKLEAYLPPYGWVSFDVSEAQKLTKLVRKADDLSEPKKKEVVERVRKRLRSGFRDNTWYLQTRGTDYDLEPKASRRVHVVRTIYAEADGVALPEPDPADPKKKEFAWMTAQRFAPDREVSYPFADYKGLAKE